MAFRTKFHILCCIFAASAPGAFSLENGLLLYGTLRTDCAAVQNFGESFRDAFDFSGMNLLTLNARNRAADLARIDASFDLLLLYGRNADALNDRIPIAVFSMLGSDTPFLLDIRKLYLSLFLPYADISVGRQIINFGHGMVFSPIDVFSSADLLDFNFRRKGADVARVRVPFSDRAGADAIVKLVSRNNGETGALKLYANFFGFDVSAVGMYRGDIDEFIGGCTFKGDAFIGISGEAVVHRPDNGDPYFICMAGADYSVSNKWFFNAEYLYNGNPTDAVAAISAVPTALSQPYINRHYGFAAIRFAWNDLMNVSANVLGDIEARSAIVTGQYYYNILQNAGAFVYVRYYGGNWLRRISSRLLPDMEYGLRIEVAF